MLKKNCSSRLEFHKNYWSRCSLYPR